MGKLPKYTRHNILTELNDIEDELEAEADGASSTNYNSWTQLKGDEFAPAFVAARNVALSLCGCF